MKTRLDFLVAGFGKCGTTTLCNLLSQHPRIYIPAEKETAYFSFKHAFGEEWFDNFFADAAPDQLLGEGSQFYSVEMYEKESVERIAAHNADIRLIFIARNPIQRMESFYRELHHSGHIFALESPTSIDQAIAAFPQMIADSMYWRRMQPWLERFDEKQIEVVFLEDLQQMPVQVVNNCLRLLEVGDLPSVENYNLKSNDGQKKYYDSMTLRRFFSVARRLTPLRASPPRYAYGRGATKMYELRIKMEPYLQRCGLRRRFDSPIPWIDTTRGNVIEAVREDSEIFLSHFGKSRDYWNLI